MKWLSAALALSSPVMAAPAGDTPESPAIAAAHQVAKVFLAAVDAGSVRTASSHGYKTERRDPKSGRVTYGSAVPESRLNAKIQARKPLGKLLERTLQKTEVLSEISSFPQGQYVRFTYALRFEKKDREVESLTIKMDYPQRGKVVRY